uniref:Uncharacterized protein n=2 Tax=Zea mays TaxID=4577 RepID=A0A804M2I8_MAIZE
MTRAKVIVSTYEELPRRHRPVTRRVASSSATTAPRAKASAPRQAGGYSRRALLLAYAQRRRRRAGRESGTPLLLEWGKWKTDHPVAGGGGDVVAMRWIGRNWCPRLRCCVRLWEKSCWKRDGFGSAKDSSVWVRQAGDCQLSALGKQLTTYGYKSPDCPVSQQTAGPTVGRRIRARRVAEPTVRRGTGLSGGHRTVRCAND